MIYIYVTCPKCLDTRAFRLTCANKVTGDNDKLDIMKLRTNAMEAECISCGHFLEDEELLEFIENL